MIGYKQNIISLVVAIVLALFLSPGNVLAHATPVLYEPENSSIIEKVPERVKIHYSERVDVDVSSIEIFGPDGNRMDMDDAFIDATNPRLFVASIKPLGGDGTYTISWKVLSADDGHFSKGAFFFSVGKETGSGVNDMDQFQVVYRSNIQEATTIFIELMGMGLLIGLFLLHLFVLLPLRKNQKFAELFRFDESYQKRFLIFIIVGVFLMIAGVLSYIVVKTFDLQVFQSISFSEALSSFVLTTGGLFALFRAGLAIILLLFFILSRKKIFDDTEGIRRLFGMLIILILIALARGRVSHAAASHFLPLFSVFVMSLQVFFKAFWVGALGALVFMVLPLARRLGNKVSLLICTSFSRFTSIAFGVVGVTGAYIVWLDLKNPELILSSAWGVRFIALSLIGVALFLLRLFHQIYIDRIVVRDGLKDMDYLRFISYTLPLEFLVGVVLLFVTSFLVITSPPVAKQSLFERVVTSQGTNVILSEHRFEDDKFLLTLSDEKTGSSMKAKKITITLFNEERGIGPVVVDTEERFEGGYVFSKKILSPSGNWRVEVAASREGLYDAVASFVLDYPKEIYESRKDPNSRMFDFFALLNAFVAVGIIIFALLLYRFSGQMLRFGLEQMSQEPHGDALFVFSSRSWTVSIVFVALLSILLWYSYLYIAKNDFQESCERDGNAWHQMTPIREGRVVSQISQSGCMAFAGAFLFADEREYRYFMSPPDAFVEMENSTKFYEGIPATLVFSVKDVNGEPVDDLTITHERILHVIIIGEDFETFNHVHPENAGPITTEMKKNGTYRIPYTFSKAGRHLVSVDYAVRSKNFTKQFIVDVEGASRMARGELNGAWQKDFDDGYSIKFFTVPGGDIVTGKQVALRYGVMKNGAPVDNLQPYLGAAMHIAIVKDDFSRFIHTHGEVHTTSTIQATTVNTATHYHPAPPKIFGPDIEAHVVFPESGLYQVLGEFQHEGKVIVTDFSVRVE